MSLSLHAALVAAVSSGLCGYLARPSAVSPPVVPCVCRCISDPGEARIADSSITVDREPRLAHIFDTTVSGVLIGVVLGFVVALVLAKVWDTFVCTLRNSLRPEPQFRRPRALAP